jgi:carboxylate-amine ligase
MGASVDDSLAALEAAPALFAAATDFTIGVEEEFQVLDAESFELTDRFEELKGLTAASPWAEHVAGELIASEIELKTGRCETFAEAAVLMRQRRHDLGTLAESVGLTLGALGTHPTSSWRDQRIIDTPHYRLVQDRLRYVAWRNNTFGLHVHVGIRDADRAISVMNQARAILPEVLAMSATSPWLEGAPTYLRSTRTQIFTRMFPRCGVPDVFGSWAEYDGFVRMLLETRSILEHTEIWWSVRPHQSFGTIEVRIAEALPDVDEAIAVAAFQVAALATFADRYDEGRVGEPLPGRLVEENLWRAIRHGLSGGFVDLQHLVEVDAGDHIRRLLDSYGPAIDRLGLAPHLGPLEDLLARGDHAGRYLARIEAGEDLKAIFVEEAAKTLTTATPVAR